MNDEDPAAPSPERPLAPATAAAVEPGLIGVSRKATLAALEPEFRADVARRHPVLTDVNCVVCIQPCITSEGEHPFGKDRPTVHICTTCIRRCADLWEKLQVKIYLEGMGTLFQELLGSREAAPTLH